MSVNALHLEIYIILVYILLSYSPLPPRAPDAHAVKYSLDIPHPQAATRTLKTRKDHPSSQNGIRDESVRNVRAKRPIQIVSIV